MKKKLMPLLLILALLMSSIVMASNATTPLIPERTGDAGFEPLSKEEQKISDEAVARILEIQNAQRIHAEIGILGDTYPTYVKLSTSGYTSQPNDATCAPTSMKNALRNWGVVTTEEAIIPHIDYTYEWGTPFNSKLPQAMNTFTNRTEWVRTAGPSAGVMWGMLTWSTQQGAPILINVVMLENGGHHLKGYNPSYEYRHYVTGIGYWGSWGAPEAEVFYHDPFDRMRLYGWVHQYGNPYGEQRATLATFEELVKDRGIVWFLGDR